MLAHLLALLLVCVPAVAQDLSPPGCRACSGHGAVPCKKHGRAGGLETLAHGTVFCSVAAECGRCGGTLEVDCRRCEDEAAEAELARRRRAVAEWRKGRREVVEEAPNREEMLFLKTPHCELCFSIRPLTVGRHKIGTHELMHLYGERIERLRTRFCETLELDDADLPGELEIFMFRDQRDHRAVGPRVTGIGASQTAGTKLMGVPCIYSMWQDPRQMPGDEELHRNLVHNVTHLLLSNLVESNWLGNRGQGWIDAGVAHWFEDALTGKCANFCFDEVLLQPGAGFKGGSWRTPVRQMLERHEMISFAELSRRNTDQLTFPEHAVAFAYVDFLLKAHGGVKFRDFLRLVKKAVPTRDALRKVYGFNPITIETAFEPWVRENYSLRSSR